MAATKCQSGRPETGRGLTNAGAGPPVTGNLAICTQPERTSAARLSGKRPGAGPCPSATPAPKSQIRNQTKSIEMATISEISSMPAHQDASRQPMPSKESLSLAVTPREPSSTLFTAVVHVVGEPMSHLGAVLITRCRYPFHDHSVSYSDNKGTSTTSGNCRPGEPEPKCSFAKRRA
ncbi:hypothetical protein PAXINDRAFT_19276 [Paxillus involutus ATCC 200175]|uniref:Unplaced genomic scaffold PAXINscaffold_537, whole genome shotgun sequence n=1 Tax=Paxillus involutus ATCC 200175 TaxID=664439 RepID=A0A0C9TJN6_PAXIN|nr:hypothetical protein PAXINDRAFT_19276 [Paxillus involutus ATCC 200175]